MSDSSDHSGSDSTAEGKSDECGIGFFAFELTLKQKYGTVRLTPTAPRDYGCAFRGCGLQRSAGARGWHLGA